MARIDLFGWDARDRQRQEDARRRMELLESRWEDLRRRLRGQVTEAYVFGSSVTGRPRAESDVDIAVSGCPPDRFYRLAAELERLLQTSLDLVDLDRAPADFAEAVRRDGRRLVP
jgi:predicted nucleotidyltransferase